MFTVSKITVPEHQICRFFRDQWVSKNTSYYHRSWNRNVLWVCCCCCCWSLLCNESSPLQKHLAQVCKKLREISVCFIIGYRKFMKIILHNMSLLIYFSSLLATAKLLPSIRNSQPRNSLIWNFFTDMVTRFNDCLQLSHQLQSPQLGARHKGEMLNIRGEFLITLL